MKALVFLVILVGIGLAVVYFSMSGFDPAQQAERLRNEVKAGMTWEEVARIHEPRKLVPYNPETVNGKMQALKFDRGTAGAAIANGTFPHGFCFEYLMSEADAIEVSFDAKGLVTSVRNMVTTKDLLQGNVTY